MDPQLHPHIEEYFQVYAWSSFGGSLDELSAAQFLNFAAAETQGVMAFAGGNAAIAAALHANLLRVLPAGSLASNSIVLEVKEVPGGVEVLYENTKGALRLVKARSVVFAAPKYVAKGIVKNLAPAQASAWKSMNYRAYVVANVLLKRKVDPKAFDLFRLQGKVPETPSFGRKPARAFTDLVFADWASRGKATQSVLTVYKPLPYDGARNSLVDAHARILRELETEMAQTLPLLGIPASELAGIRLTRWAHSVPLAEPGLIKNGSLEKIGAPHGRISFANQDNYMNPAFETAFSAAEKAAGEARKFL